MSMSRVSIARTRLGALLTIACCVSACGGDNKGSDGVILRGGERLAWDQIAESVQQLNAMRFRLYVDGNLSTLGAPTCSVVASSGKFECSGVLPAMSPGGHTLTLTSVLGGVESRPSVELTVLVEKSGGATTQSRPPAVLPQRSRTITRTTCAVEVPAECYDLRLLAVGLGRASSLSPAPDGRLFLVEGDDRVRIIAKELVPEPALVLDRQGSRIVGLAVDDAFESTRAIYVAWTEESTERPMLNITRYREVQGSLGQGATIITGLPFRTGASAHLAVSRQGLLFVALPFVNDRRSPTGDSIDKSGTVLRFERDGSVPRTDVRASPIIAKGYGQPTGLVVDPNDRVWLTGQDSNDRESLVSFAIDDRSSWPIVPVPALAYTRSDSRDVDVLSLGNRLYLAAAAGRLRQVRLSSDGLATNVTEIPVDGTMRVRAVATAQDGIGYAALSADENGPASIVQITVR